ncbi:cytochrome c oxidase subunit II [Roseibium sp. RKSG952]|uniref:cytochrome c oxidase subunit II n=1 Tax=Roseibium sp. RKSG952 TaxID=2529384 RepID=UPI0034CD5658
MKSIFKRLLTMTTATGASAAAATAAFASDGGMSPWQLGLQNSISSVMDDITWFNSFTLVIITVITLFVLALLIYVGVKFRADRNPVPSRTSHNTAIEVIWTVVPILILVVIAIPSFRLLYKQLDIPEYDMTVKATGYQWYWGYEYTDEGMNDLEFSSYPIGDTSDPEADKAARQEVADERGVPLAEVPRLLAVDYEMVVPVDTTVRLQVTAADVIHAFAMPSMGVKIDAIPGRLNETWFHARETGVYYGQCSELCGILHYYMPIAIRVVTPEQYKQWANAAQEDLDVANKQLMASINAEKNKKLAAAKATGQETAATN